MHYTSEFWGFIYFYFVHLMVKFENLEVNERHSFLSLPQHSLALLPAYRWITDMPRGHSSNPLTLTSNCELTHARSAMQLQDYTPGWRPMFTYCLLLDFSKASVIQESLCLFPSRFFSRYLSCKCHISFSLSQNKTSNSVFFFLIPYI